MSLREEIQPYIDGNGLVAPNLTGNAVRGSDNGVMYTAEYLIMLKYLRCPLPYITISCVDECFDEAKGILSRAPGDKGQEGPDDYYAFCALLSVMRWYGFGKTMLYHGFKHFGFFDNGNGGGSAFLWRQLQMIAAMASAAGLGWVPLFWPFYLFAALVIATSCIGVPTSQADPRRLSWHLIQATWRSPLTRLASKIWYRRLYRDYGPDGMKAVAKVYYRDNHPFQRYWVDKQP